jgi:hypothetical protein
MKKIITICLLLAGMASARAGTTPIFHKSNGGWFGYKYVTTTTWPDEGITVVACSDPGVTRCKMAAAAIAMPHGPDLTAEHVEGIERAIAGVLTAENTSGTLIYGENFFVTFNYNIEEDDLMFTVYCIQEATELGLIH